MFLLWDWLDILYEMAKKVRPTTAWLNYKSYLETILNGAHTRFCNTSNETDLKNHRNFCKQLKSRMKTLKNKTQKHCKLKEKGCREYCEQHCDHFVDMGTSEYYPKCPNKNQQTNSTVNEVSPADDEIQDYLDKFVAGKDCLE